MPPRLGVLPSSSMLVLLPAFVDVESSVASRCRRRVVVGLLAAARGEAAAQHGDQPERRDRPPRSMALGDARLDGRSHLVPLCRFGRRDPPPASLPCTVA